ncbi:MAG: tRNA pseudouridine(38-40) synthase TruA [Bacteroidetes bacterium]|nr:tRNA pseudouridine(38-40) synthase TruA [Bacteroidota bacterium]
MRYFIRLAYKGTNYSVWQIQENAVSVQEKLNQSLSVILNQDILSTGCGRTDTGVHAKQFYAHFDCFEQIADPKKVLHQLNSILPSDISVYDILEMESGAHSRFDAMSRTYEYFIAKTKNPFAKEFSLHGYMNPDMALMNEACLYLLKHNDFSSFRKTNTQVKSNICTIASASWSRKSEMLVFTITADRFLRGMVRAIVGTMIDVGTGKIQPEKISEIILSKNRNEAGASVPACGLFLSNVVYPYLPVIQQSSFPA